MFCNEHSQQSLPSERAGEGSLLDRARRYCAAQEQCSEAVRRKLAAWGATEGEADGIVARLEEEGYLDDVRYARAYCESKLLRQHWGRQKVAFQLRLKGLPREAIEAGMEAVDDEPYLAALQGLVERRMEGAARDAQSVRKLTASLMSRGYSYSEINQVITNILQS